MYFILQVKYLLFKSDIDASGDDLEGSGDKGKGDKVVASGDGKGYDNGDVYSGSGSGMGPDDEDEPPRYPERPSGVRPGVRPGYTRPIRPNQPPDGDIGFQNPNNPKYDISKPNNKDKNVGGTASNVSSSALLILSAMILALRAIL